MVVRVVRRDRPHSVLPYRREVELVVQWAFYQAKGHVPAEGIGIHSVLLNPQVTLRTAMVFPVIVYVGVSLEPKEQRIYRPGWVNQVFGSDSQYSIYGLLGNPRKE